MARAHGFLAVLAVAGVFLAGCGDAMAQQAKRIEHGVFEYSKLRLAHGEQEKINWATAEKEIAVESVLGLWAALGIQAETGGPRPDRLRVLDHLAGKGWEVIERTDVTIVLAGGTGISERYLLRRGP